MTGIDIKNEKVAADSRLTPVAKIVDIVVPLRDKPGTTAIPWAIPTAIADLMPTSRSLLGMKFVKNKMTAVARNENGKILYVNVRSMTSLNATTMPHVMAVAIIKQRFVLLMGWRKSCQIWRRKTNTTASSVATCNTMLNINMSPSMPNMC